jgi:Methyltransferase domain
MVTVDPFAVKHYPRWHPFRLAHKSLSVAREWEARRHFRRYALPEMLWEEPMPALPEVDWDSTSVTPTQMRHLLRAVAATESLTDTVIVEVGCFRGVTTRCLAGATSRKLIAVDPYGGYGGAAADRDAFRRRIAGLDNVIHEAKTSGAAARAWDHGPASLVFIDAIHDYVNTSFDIGVWAPKLVRGGILALHDVDQVAYAGTRRAAFESLGRFELVAHPDNLALFVAR